MIYFLRHGLDDERYVGGYSNVGLTKEGIIGVRESSIKLKGYNIYIGFCFILKVIYELFR